MTHNPSPAQPRPEPTNLSPEDFGALRETLTKACEEGLHYYKDKFLQLLSPKRPFTDSQLKTFHVEVLKELTSFFDSTFQVITHAPKGKAVVKKSKEKLSNDVNSLLETYLSMNEANIKNVQRLLKDFAAESENQYFDNMAEFHPEDQPLEAIQAQHAKVKEKVVQDFEESVLSSKDLEYFEPWMATELTSKLDESFDEAVADKVADCERASAPTPPEDVSTLSSKLDCLIGLVERLTVENERMLEGSKRTEELYESRIRALEGSLSELMAKNQVLEEEMSVRRNESKDLKENIASLEDASECLNVDLVNHMDELESALNAAEKSNEDLKDQIISLQENLDSKSALIFDLLGKIGKIEKSTEKFPAMITQMETVEKRLGVLETFKTRSEERFGTERTASSLERIKGARPDSPALEKPKVTRTDSGASEKSRLVKTNSVAAQNGRARVVAVTLKNIPKELPVMRTAGTPSTLRKVVRSPPTQERTPTRFRSKINPNQVQDAIKSFEGKSTTSTKKREGLKPAIATGEKISKEDVENVAVNGK